MTVETRERLEASRRHGPLARAIARLLLLALATATPLPSSAGDEFQDPNNATFGSDVELDNSIAGQTNFSINSGQTTIHWQDFQQPANNVTDFNFTNPGNAPIVFNYIGAQHPSTIQGGITSNGTVAISNPYGVFIGGEAVIDVGAFVAAAGHLVEGDLQGNDPMVLNLEGTVRNDGLILAENAVTLIGQHVINTGEIRVENGDLLLLAAEQVFLPDLEVLTGRLGGEAGFFAHLDGKVVNSGVLRADNAALLGQRVVNYGEIYVDDGSLLLGAGDAMYVARFDDPVLIQLPAQHSNRRGAGSYGVENHGQLDAGLGHVRLAAADPLGLGIRQGRGTPDAPASIRAREITIDGGETGRVHLSGLVDASADPGEGTGGQIDVTGNLIALDDATLLASGDTGGGIIHVGGEQQGRGDLQRARAVVIDEHSTIRADAREDGDGGRVIVFSEDLTAIEGTISARGGASGGAGGFVETSGLRQFSISRAPDARAPAGAGGLWLIDPFDITIVTACTPGVSCLDDAITSILSPDFDSTAFDGLIRPTGTSEISADLIATSLAVGTSVSLTTEAFGLDPGADAGNITVDAAISIASDDAVPGTQAILTLLAANDIRVNQNIEITGIDPVSGSNIEIGIALRANDPAQAATTFENSLEGRVDVADGVNISTGGGGISFQGADIRIGAAGGLTNTITTDGGFLDFRTGTLTAGGNSSAVGRTSPLPADFMIDAGNLMNPELEVHATIDTSARTGDGGSLNLLADSINVSVTEFGDTYSQVFQSKMTVGSESIFTTGGGDISLNAGITPTSGNASRSGDLTMNGEIDSGGGDIQIIATRLDDFSNGGNVQGDADFDTTDGMNERGGRSTIAPSGAGIVSRGGTVQIGGARTARIDIEGVVDTTSLDASNNGLLLLRAREEVPDNSDGSAIAIGSTAAGATFTSAGMIVDARTVTTQNTTDLTSIGSSAAVLDDVVSSEISVQGPRSIRFADGAAASGNTTLQADTIRIAAGQNEVDASDITRLVFGSNGNTTQLNGDVIAIASGNGVDPTADTFAPESGSDTDILRRTNIDFDGLRAANRTGLFRPQELSIFQDGDLVVESGTTVSTDLDLAQVFAGLGNGLTGLDLTLGSFDGVLSVNSAAGLAGSRLTLQGGLFLPVDAASDTIDAANNTVVLGSAFDASPIGATELTIISPGDLVASDSLITRAIGSFPGDTPPDSFSIRAGVETAPEGSTLTSRARGTLRVEAGTHLAAVENLSLQAGASGTGDLEFETGVTLSGTSIDLRAGAGSDALVAGGPRSRITGLQGDLQFRSDAAGSDFIGTPTVPPTIPDPSLSVTFRQDNGFDVESDLPNRDQFRAAGGGPLSNDVQYSIRSDLGQVDLGNDGSRFEGANLSVIGRVEGFSPAITLSAGFDFIGGNVELGAINNFDYDEVLQMVFNGTAGEVRPRITLRAGVGGGGTLGIPGVGASVRAEQIFLIASDGTGGDVTSLVNPAGAQFSSSADPNVGPDVFVFQQDASISEGSLPAQSQFGDGMATSQPRVLALRSDDGTVSLTNPRTGSGADTLFAALPVNVADPNSQVILEGREVSLNQINGLDLDLNMTAAPRLRIRATELLLSATGSPTQDARVLSGLDAPPPTTGLNADFESTQLLIEAFDTDADVATIENLSRLSAALVPTPTVAFDLSTGRGPSAITIQQEGPVSAGALPYRESVSGFFAITDFLDTLGNEIAANYRIQSFFDSVGVDAAKVQDSDLTLVGVFPRVPTADDSAIDFAPGSYDLANLTVESLDEIRIADGVMIAADRSISMTAGTRTALSATPTDRFGSLIFEGAGTSSLTAELVFLSAGPTSPLFELEAGADGVIDELGDDVLPILDLRGLAGVEITSPTSDASAFLMQQSASLTIDPDGGTGTPDEMARAIANYNILDGLLNGGTARIARVSASSAQGNVDFDGIAGTSVNGGGDQSLTDVTRSLFVRAGRNDVLTVPVPENDAETGPAPISPFDGFIEGVEFDANTLVFTTEDDDTLISLDTERITLTSDATLTGGRPLVRYEQRGSFELTELPSRARYFSRSPITNDTSRRTSIAEIDIELRATDATQALVFGESVRNTLSGSNLILNSLGDVEININTPTPGYATLPDLAAIQLASLTIGTDLADLDMDGDLESAGTGDITIQPFGADPVTDPLTIQTSGSQTWDGQIVLNGALELTGPNISALGGIRDGIAGASAAGLTFFIANQLVIGGDVGTSAERLAHLDILFTSNTGGSPAADFGLRDASGNPISSNQTVYTRDDVLIQSDNFGVDAMGNRLRNGTRTRSAPYATVGKGAGDLTFDSSAGSFLMGQGERLSVGGTATVIAEAGSAVIGDVTALALRVISPSIAITRRKNGRYYDSTGSPQSDAGVAWLANFFELIDGVATANPVTPVVTDDGRNPVIGLPTLSGAPAGLEGFPFFEIFQNGRPLALGDFQFASGDPVLFGRIPDLHPIGASDSDIAEAFGPILLPVPERFIPEPDVLIDPERLTALDVDPLTTPREIVLARLRGGAVIDDFGLAVAGGLVPVTEARLDARDAERAIELHRRLFGGSGTEAKRVRATLQEALDRYLAETRSRRVVGFEFRRFVKNRPSSLLKGYKTLEDLDLLFRYHRRLGLSPGEFRGIQANWLRQIQPDGITLDELSEAIHPSRYVRGSDILDIFGR